MHNARFRVMAGLAGATLCLFAVTSYAQTPATTGTAGTEPSAQTTPPATDQGITTTATDVTTTTSETWSFPGGTLGIVAVAVLVLLVLFAVFRGRDSTTVVKETYTATPPVTRTTSTGTAADDRLNVNSRAASGTGNNPGGMNDPNARR